ncbi:hypothetical protein GCM10022226_50480 [Sphaerisporangium flaviroseum]|uniref:Uncharacterized protein n=1 Tax=Sphaerisporangium flaviroseum TaxID=509199 RepID=A0ABP7IQ69_9ACTN
MHVDLPGIEAVDGGHHHRIAVHDHAQMAHEPAAKHLEEGRTVVTTLFPEPTMPGSLCCRQITHKVTFNH